MYIHLGEDCLVKSCDIIGVFDLEKTSISKHTKSFLKNATVGKMVVNVSYAMPKSFVVCNNKKEKKEATVYISQISSNTLKKRSEKMNVEGKTDGKHSN